MKYWDDMQDKWGFGDGDQTPPDAQACRTVYLQAVNHLLELEGSAFRYVLYDRPGMHNSCLVVRVMKENVGASLDGGEWFESTERDDALLAALQRAGDLDLDSYIVTRVEIDQDGLDDLLTNLPDI